MQGGVVRRVGVPKAVLAGLAVGLSHTVGLAGPNLIAIGNYGEVAYKRATGRDSLSDSEIIFHFEDPEYDFGRVVIRTSRPKSVVRRDLFVGFTGESLRIDRRDTGGGRRGRWSGADEVEIWLRIKGKIRSERSYEWEMEIEAESDRIDGGFPAVIPAFWADGEPVGAEVTVRDPQPEETDAIVRMLLPHGVVSLPSFRRQTGGAWIVLRPRNFGGFFGLRRLSFREVDTPESLSGKTEMPIPVRYIPIRDVLEDRVAEAMERGTEALNRLRNAEHYWSGTDLEDSVITTSLIVSALAEHDPSPEALLPAMHWLRGQESPSNEPWGTETVARRLYCLARHGGIARFRRIIHSDTAFLTHAQFEDGGWSRRSWDEGAQATASIRSDNERSALVLAALREARFAGAEIEKRVWRKVMKYWTDAQAFDGGFRSRLERYGGIGQATTSTFTALGGASLIAALDMAEGYGGRHCTSFRASRGQLHAITRAMAWLDDNYGEPHKNLGGFAPVFIDPYLEPAAFQWLGDSSGVAHFNEKSHFGESARKLLYHYDRAMAMFGLRGSGGKWAQEPSAKRTAQALTILGAGAAPTVCQRIIVGGDESGWAQYKGDVSHLVRYLSARRGRPFNWRRTTIDRDVRELVEVPILLLNVVGKMNWSHKEWSKIREYCLAGGTVVIDVDNTAAAQREVVIAGLARAFPEYSLSTLPDDSPIFTMETTLFPPPPVQALDNGFRTFLLFPTESWSCRWHLYRVREHEDSFALMHNLLTYATDSTAPRSSFALSTYAVGSIPRQSMTAAHLEVGGDVEAYPNLIDTMDRLMQANFRLEVKETSDPGEADLVWVSVTGETPAFDSLRGSVLGAIRAGKFLFVDIVGGSKGWDETFRAMLGGLEGVSLQKLRRRDPVYTGEIPGTQGFDVTVTPLRKALRTRFATRGRCDLYAIFLAGRQVGVYSAYDISSGIGYHYFPGCRGVMPGHARRLAMNAFLSAYARKFGADSGG